MHAHVRKMNAQSKIPLGAKILVTLLAPAALYWQDLSIVANEALRSELSTHILAIPFLLAYILYRLRGTFAANALEQPATNSNYHLELREALGILICLLAYFIRWYGSYTFTPLEYHIASLPLFVAGVILIIFNLRTLRVLLFPTAFLALLTPPPFELAQRVGTALAGLSAQASFAVLKTIGMPVTLQPLYGSPVIQLTTSQGVTIPFAIDIACSGLHSFIGFIIFALFAVYISRGPLPKKIIVFTLGVPIIYAFNILRITLLVIIGYFFGSELALDTFHLLGGWILILAGTIILLIIAEKVFNIQIFGKIPETCLHPKHDKDGIYCLSCGKILNPPHVVITQRDIIKLATILFVVASLLYIQVPVFALTQSAAEVFIKKPTGEEVSTEILPELEGYTLRFISRDHEFENISGQDASLTFRYSTEDWTELPIWVGLEIGSTKSCLHGWEVCLITYPQGGEVKVTQLDLRGIHLLDNPPLPARYFVFQEKDSDFTQVVLYWYTNSIFKTNEGYEKKFSKISVIKYTQNPQEYKIIEAELLPIAEDIANYWRPITSWSWISLTIAKNGLIIITTTVALLFGVIDITLYLQKKNKNNAKHIYTQISEPEDRYIIDSIKELENEMATEIKIASKYNEITGKNIETERLHNKILEAEELNIIKRKILNINDEPYMAWRVNFL